MAKLTLWGLWKHYHDGGYEMFDALHLPTSTKITAQQMKDTAIKSILYRCGEMGLLFPDPVALMTQMDLWSSSHLPVWQKIMDALEIEYAPLENYDRREEWTDDTYGSRQRSGSGDSSTTAQGAGAETISGTPSATESVSAYNTDQFAPERKTESTLSQNTVSHGDQAGTESHSESESEQHTTQNARAGRAHGNIGVVSSQDMLLQEFEVALKASIFERIANDFMAEFCIMVY